MPSKKRVLRATLRILSLCFAAAWSLSCVSQPPRPWPGKVFVGDPDRVRIYRMQSGEEVQCTDPKFKDYLALSYDDFMALFNKASEDEDQ